MNSWTEWGFLVCFLTQVSCQNLGNGFYIRDLFTTRNFRTPRTSSVLVVSVLSPRKKMPFCLLDQSFPTSLFEKGPSNAQIFVHPCTGTCANAIKVPMGSSDIRMIGFFIFSCLRGYSVQRRTSQSKKTVFLSRNLRVDQPFDEEPQSQNTPSKRKYDISIFKGKIHMERFVGFQVFKLGFFDFYNRPRGAPSENLDKSRGRFYVTIDLLKCLKTWNGDLEMCRRGDKRGIF